MSGGTAAEPVSVPTAGDLRRRLGVIPGVVAATGSPPASQGRAEEARIVPGTLVEPAPLRARPVGNPEPWPGQLAFLDGIQRHEVIGYAECLPLVRGEVAAAVRERNGREGRTVIYRRKAVVIGRPEALRQADAALQDCQTVSLDSDEPAHPLRDLELARAAVDRIRGEVEREVGNGYRSGSDSWLIVDGSLAEFPDWANDGRTLGVSKSHATLPFGGPELAEYLRLPALHRSSVFQPASRHWAPVYAWGLRLWDWTGRDLFYGLVRVEASPTAESLAQADRISRWLLAERAPISADPRWDRLLYGIHGVEEFLRACLRNR